MKIILALGNTQAEDSLIASLPRQCKVVGIAPYREAVLTKLQEAPSADVLLIRDNIGGTIPILKLIHQVRSNYPHCRIILMTKQREAGDPFLSQVVSFGVMDIIIGYKTRIPSIIDYLLNPRTFKDVERFQIRTFISEDEPTAQTVDYEQVASQQGASSQPTISQSSKDPKTQDSNHPLPTSGRPKLKPIPIETPHSIDSFENDDIVFDLGGFSSEHEGVNEEVTNTNAFFVEKDEKEVSSKPVTPSKIKTKPIPVPIPTPIPSEIPEPTDSSFKKASPEKVKEGKPKILSNEDMKGVKRTPKGSRQAFSNTIKNSPIIMSLVGVRGGVGTTQVGLNLAISLAQKKNRVLFVELNDSGLPFTYLYGLAKFSDGLEKALEEASTSMTPHLKPFVIDVEKEKKSTNKEIASVFSKYPNSLDFLAFSQFFGSSDKRNYHPEKLKDVLTSLLLSEGYQYIILDVNLRSDERLIEQALISSKFIFPVITQSPLVIGEAMEFLTQVNSKKFDLTGKVNFLINRYQPEFLKEKVVLKWANNDLPFKIQNAWVIPEETKLFQKSDFKTIPVLLNNPPKSLIQAFDTLHNYLKTM